MDLDDPTLRLSHFVKSVSKALADHPKIIIEIFACASTKSDRIVKMCGELKVKLIIKPITVGKIKPLLKAYYYNQLKDYVKPLK